jgi:hypothetical protein
LKSITSLSDFIGEFFPRLANTSSSASPNQARIRELGHVADFGAFFLEHANIIFEDPID